MLKEVNCAVNFVASLLRRQRVDTDVLNAFREQLFDGLCIHYRDHWFPEKPLRGSAYRCIRIVNGQMDPILQQACTETGLCDDSALNIFPRELTLWIDPSEVSYRIGEDGSVGHIDVLDSTDELSSPSLTTQCRDSQPPSPMAFQKRMYNRQMTVTA